ncbi:MAG: type II secretion system protein N [Pseudomonadota bacterium]
MSAFIVWAALAASAVFWGLRLAGASPSAPAHTVPVGGIAVSSADLTRLFGAEPVPEMAAAEAPVAESSRFRLIGLAAPRSAGGPGVAVISTDGKPPRAYRIGAVVDGDLVLQNVERRSVALGPSGGPATVRLELPPLPAAATGSLPPPPSMEVAPPGVPPQALVPLPPPGMQPPPSGMRPSPQPPTAVGVPQAPVMQPPPAAQESSAEQ